MVAASRISPCQILEKSGVSPNFLEQVFGRKNGVASNTTQIILNGDVVLVGKNLDKALRTLREILEV